MTVLEDRATSRRPTADSPDGGAATDPQAENPSSARKIAVVLNQQSGRRNGDDERQALVRRIEGADGITLLRLEPRDDIKDVFRKAARDHDVVVAAGGDGTISAACNALSGSGATLGVLPLGTFNFFARSIGLPQDPEEAWDTIRTGRPQPLAIGEVNGSNFINNASIGAYATILEARETVYRRWGRSRLMAYWSVLSTLSRFEKPLKMRITVDGAIHHARSSMAFVAIRPYQLREYGLDGAGEIERGQLVVYLAPNDRRLKLIWRALKVLFGAVTRHEDYRMLHGKQIVIETARERQLVARDGERERLTGPFVFRRHDDALKVIVPADAPGAD